MNYLLDTNVVSELVARQPNHRVVQWIERIDPERAYLSVITLGEIQKGIEKLADSPRKETLRTWLAEDLLLRFEGRILPIDAQVMLLWGTRAAQLERSGNKAGLMDSLIAAICEAFLCTLVTRNVADFKAMDIPVINPWDD